MNSSNILSQHKNANEMNLRLSKSALQSPYLLMLLGVLLSGTSGFAWSQNQPQVVTSDKTKLTTVSDKEGSSVCTEEDWRKGLCIQVSGGRRLTEEERKQLRQQLKSQ